MNSDPRCKSLNQVKFTFTGIQCTFSDCPPPEEEEEDHQYIPWYIFLITIGFAVAITLYGGVYLVRKKRK